MGMWLEENLVCPRDLSNLQFKNDILICASGHRYPCIDGIPVMLLEEVSPTHAACCELFKEMDIRNKSYLPGSETESTEGVDRYVQQEIAATGGNLYREKINKLTRYPIPQLRLPRTMGQHFLDIGCNWGRWCISAAKQGYKPVGIDPSLDAIRAARRVAQQLGISALYVVADARYIPFRNGSFDAVFSYSVFQHFDKDDVKLSLGEIAKILKKNGTSLIQMANVFGLRNLYNQSRRGFRKPQSFEVRYWRTTELKDTFSSIIGPTSLLADSYFCLNAQMSDLDILPPKYKLVVYCSEMLRKVSEKMTWMRYFADSLYVRSIKK